MSKNLGDFMDEEDFDQAVIELLTLALIRLTCARVNDKGGVRHVALTSYDAGIVASLMQQGLVEWKGKTGELDLTDDGFFFGDIAAARVGMALIESLQVVADPKHPDREDMLAWADAQMAYPFDLAAKQRELADCWDSDRALWRQRLAELLD